MMNIMMPTKFKPFYKEFNNTSFDLLDVGCGNRSASNTKRVFKNVNYHGVDKGSYNNTDEDFKLMDKFFLIDLCESAQLSIIPDNSYDVIIFSHVVEHLYNGLEIVALLCNKLRKNGVIYIESPSEISLYLPSMPGTLNFYDDPTHVKMYSVEQISNAVNLQGFDVIRSGIRRDKTRVLLTPYIILKSYLKFGQFTSRGLWDPLGFAQFVYARKM